MQVIWDDGKGHSRVQVTGSFSSWTNPVDLVNYSGTRWLANLHDRVKPNSHVVYRYIIDGEWEEDAETDKADRTSGTASVIAPDPTHCCCSSNSNNGALSSSSTSSEKRLLVHHNLWVPKVEHLTWEGHTNYIIARSSPSSSCCGNSSSGSSCSTASNSSSSSSKEADSSSPFLVCLIPGNPGLCEYYEEYVCALAGLLPPHSAVVAASHLGYKPGRPEPRVFTLDEQVDHMIRFVNWLVTNQQQQDMTGSNSSSNSSNSPTTPKLVILGHSVGCWMAQRVVVALTMTPQQPPSLSSSPPTAPAPLTVYCVGMLAPTIRNIGLSDNGVFATKATRYVGGRFFYALAVLFHWVAPLSWIISLGAKMIAFSGGYPPSYAPLASSMVQWPTIFRQVTTMGIEEMHRIGDGKHKPVKDAAGGSREKDRVASSTDASSRERPPPSRDQPQPSLLPYVDNGDEPATDDDEVKDFWSPSRVPRIWGLFAQKDGWVSTATRSSLIAAAATVEERRTNVRLEVAADPLMQHAWCLRQSVEVARLTAAKLLGEKW